MVSRTGWWLRGGRRAGKTGAHARVQARLVAGRHAVLAVLLALVASVLAIGVSVGPASAAVLGPGQATIPGFVGYVTATNTELGIGRMPNGRYGICTDTGAEYPWPGNPSIQSNPRDPRTAYLLTHFMDDAIDDPKMAAALWWTTGLDFGQNSQPNAMRDRIAQMQAESPGIYSDVNAIRVRMISQANQYAAPAGGYTASINLVGIPASDEISVQGLGVKSGSTWVPDEKITVTLTNATFDATSSTIWSGRSQDAAMALAAHQMNPGVVTARITATNLAGTDYQVWWGGGSTQHVFARGDYDTATANDATNDDSGRARLFKTNGTNGAPLAGAAIRAWGDNNNNQRQDAGEIGVDLTTGADGFTPNFRWYAGAPVCFRETAAPAGFAINPVVQCGSAAAIANTPLTFNLENAPLIARVPIVVTKTAEGNDSTGIIGVVVQTKSCPDESCGWIEAHRFTAADIRADGVAQWEFERRYDSNLEYWVQISEEPAGWKPVYRVLKANLVGDATYFGAGFLDRRYLQPSLSTQISLQRASVGRQISDVVTIQGMGNHQTTGRWRLLGPVAAPGNSCVGVDWSQAPTAAAGEFAAQGGSFEVGFHTVATAGCYTYQAALDESEFTAAVPWHAAGLVEETVLVQPGTNISTEASTQVGLVGSTMRDRVTVTGTNGETLQGIVTLFGPATPAAGSVASSDSGCDALSRANVPGEDVFRWRGQRVALREGFTVTGDGTYVVGEYQVLEPGCYSYEIEISEGVTVERTFHGAGIDIETSIFRYEPTLVTQISDQRSTVGDTIRDAVTISGTGGELVSGQWRLLGPMSAVLVQGKPTCVDVDWTGSPVAAQGRFEAAGDRTITVGEYTVAVAGCYTYVESLDAGALTAPMAETRAGIVEETTLARSRPQLVTQISDQTSLVGDTITDDVIVTGTAGVRGPVVARELGKLADGATIPGKWRLLGPARAEFDTQTGKATCVGIDWSTPDNSVVAAEGDFTVTGDGTYTVGEYKIVKAGCYTYVESLEETGDTFEFEETAPGIPEETTLARAVPTLVTQISKQRVVTGSTITDDVMVSGTGGATVPGRWRLLGPVAAVLKTPGVPASVTCVGVDWKGAPVAAEGDFTATGDGTYTVGEYKVVKAGCFTYVESLQAAEDDMTVPMDETAAGIPEETTVALDNPSLVTQVSDQMAAVGTTITDAVTVTGTGGATITGKWRLLGPLTPVLSPQGHTCKGVDWKNAAVAAEGDFKATGDGTYTVGEYKVVKAGCYTYVESMGATSTSNDFPETKPGIPSETTLITNGPRIVTAINDQQVIPGETVFDQVDVAGTDGATVQGRWWLYGPVAPVMVGGTPSCEPLDWTQAAVAAEGDFTVTGDGSYMVGEHTIVEPGCYSYKEALAATETTTPVATLVGITAETTVAMKATKGAGSSDNGSDDDTGDKDKGGGDNGGDDSPPPSTTATPPLPDTGAPSGLWWAARGSLVLVGAGAAMLFVARRRRREPVLMSGVWPTGG